MSEAAKGSAVYDVQRLHRAENPLNLLRAEKGMNETSVYIDRSDVHIRLRAKCPASALPIEPEPMIADSMIPPRTAFKYQYVA
jgi:hypothetical protein